MEEFATAITDADVQLVGLNFFAGDMAGGDRGLVSWPARSTEFRDNIDVTVALGERLGCRAFNAYTATEWTTAHRRNKTTSRRRPRARASRPRAEGGTVLVEPVGGAPDPPVHCRRRAEGDRAGPRLKGGQCGLFDVYHLAVNGDDVDAAIDASAGRIGHVQIADAPGRNEPGTGTLDIDHYLGRLAATGYDGWVGLEYKPSGKSVDSFGWLPPERRSATG